jgi:outer membrane protein assembly factor BamC
MFLKKFCYIPLLFLLSCSTADDFIDDITAPDYVSSSKAKRLEIPPDLSEIDSSEAYSTPGEAKSYKKFLDKQNQNIDNASKNQKKLVKNPDGIRLVKSGNLRWLVIDKDPDLVWPYVKEFWEDLGFRVIVSNKRTGILETEWMNSSDIKIDSNTNSISKFDKWLDSLAGFSDKRKFRTRVEYGENNTTEIYISQRSAEAALDQHSRILKERESDYNPSTLYKIERYKEEGDDEIPESRKLDDYEIDSELLTRLMVKLGASDFTAKSRIENPEIIVKAELKDSTNDLFIKMNDPYDRSWRRLGLVLDIIGFITEDKNRSEGIYYVRFTEIELPQEKKKEEEGLIDSLIFWDQDNEEDDNSNSKSESNEPIISVDENIDNGEKYSGIEAPEIRPIDEDYNPDEYLDDGSKESVEEETWITGLWPSWGDEDKEKKLPDNEKRYRIRIKPSADGTTIVYLDYSNGSKNLSKEARKILSIITEYLN